MDSDNEAANTSKPTEEGSEEKDSAGLDADGTVNSVSHVANNIVDSASAGPEEIVDPGHVVAAKEEIVDPDHVVAANSVDEPVLDEPQGDVDMDASTKQVLSSTQGHSAPDNVVEGRINLGGDSEGDSENTPSPKHHSSDEDAHSEASEENKSVSAEGMKDADDDADDGDTAEGNKASSESGREDESEERDEEENFVSLTLAFLLHNVITRRLLRMDFTNFHTAMAV